MSPSQEKQLREEFIRDVTSVVPRSKSDMRERLEYLIKANLTLQKEEIRKEIKELSDHEGYGQSHSYQKAVAEALNLPSLSVTKKE